MLASLLPGAALLATAWLFGGMLLFAAGFAAFVFKALPITEARALIRKAFPPFYLFVIFAASLAAALAAAVDPVGTVVLALVALTTMHVAVAIATALPCCSNSPSTWHTPRPRLAKRARP